MKSLLAVVVLGGVAHAEAPKTTSTCRTVQLSPVPQPAEYGTGLAHDTEVRACDGAGACKAVATIAKGRHLRNDGSGVSADCTSSAIEVVIGGEPGDLELWMLDLVHAKVTRSKDFRGNADMGGGRWMGNRYVYSIGGPYRKLTDVYDAGGARLYHYEPSDLEMSPDGRFLLGYPGEADEGDRRVTVLDVATLVLTVLDEHPGKPATRGTDNTDVTWSAGVVEVPLHGHRMKYPLPK